MPFLDIIQLAMYAMGRRLTCPMLRTAQYMGCLSIISDDYWSYMNFNSLDNIPQPGLTLLHLVTVVSASEIGRHEGSTTSTDPFRCRRNSCDPYRERHSQSYHRKGSHLGVMPDAEGDQREWGNAEKLFFNDYSSLFVQTRGRWCEATKYEYMFWGLPVPTTLLLHAAIKAELFYLFYICVFTPYILQNYLSSKKKVVRSRIWT